MFFNKLHQWTGRICNSRRIDRSRPAGPTRSVYQPRLEPLEDRMLLSAFQVKDINTDTVSSNPSNLTNVNGTLFLTAADNSHQLGL